MKEKEFEKVKEKIIEMVKDSKNVIVFGTDISAGVIGNEASVMATLGTIIDGLKRKRISKEKVQFVIDTVYGEKDELDRKLRKVLSKALEGFLND